MKIVVANSWEQWNAGRCTPHLIARLVNRVNCHIGSDHLIFAGSEEAAGEIREAREDFKSRRLADPFAYAVYEDGEVSIESLLLDKSLGLCDYHIHTPLAYCNENIEPEVIVEMARLLGLRQIGFSEHSGHLYFPESNYWGSWEWYGKGMNSSDIFDHTADYLKLVMPLHSDYCRIGLEVDVDAQGNLLVRPALGREMDYLIGAVHYLPEVTNGAGDREMSSKLLSLTGALLESGCRYIAHPLREITWNNRRRIPESLPLEMAKLLASYGAAAELNYHKNIPDDRFVLACLENGVKFHFGGDVHVMHELGEFYPQLRQLKRLAPGVDIPDVLAGFPEIKSKEIGIEIDEEISVAVNA